MREVFSVTVSAILASCVLACSKSPSEAEDEAVPPPPPPAEVIATSVSARKTSLAGETLTISMENKGGAGFFKVQAWGLPTTPNGAQVMFGETEATQVPAGWRETVSYALTTNRSGTLPSTRYIIVFTRTMESVQFRETARLNLVGSL